MTPMLKKMKITCGGQGAAQRAPAVRACSSWVAAHAHPYWLQDGLAGRELLLRELGVCGATASAQRVLRERGAEWPTCPAEHRAHLGSLLGFSGAPAPAAAGPLIVAEYRYYTMKPLLRTQMGLRTSGPGVRAGAAVVGAAGCCWWFAGGLWVCGTATRVAQLPLAPLAREPATRRADKGLLRGPCEPTLRLPNLRNLHPGHLNSRSRQPWPGPASSPAAAPAAATTSTAAARAPPNRSPQLPGQQRIAGAPLAPCC